MLGSNKPANLNVQKTENGVTYKPETDSPWGTFTFPIADTTYTIHALPSQDADYFVEWEIEVYIQDAFNNSSKWEYVDGIIAAYDRFRGTFKVSALDNGVYIFRAESHGWMVETRIKK